MLSRTLDEIAAEAKAWATSEHSRVGIGYSVFDSRTRGGAAQGEVILFTARSGVGKTAFACNVIENNADVATVFFSLEMHSRFILNRLAAIHTGTSTNAVEAGLQAGEDTLLERTLRDFPLLTMADKPAMSFKEMESALREAEDQLGRKPQFVIIDFLELIGGVVSLEAVSAVDKVARKVKDFARATDTTVLALHQVGRGSGGEGHLPLTATSGRFGGEVSADYLLAAYRPCFEPGLTQAEYLRRREQINLQFLKTRGGSEIHPGGVMHRIDPESLRITEIGAPPIYVDATRPDVPVYSEDELQLVGMEQY